MLILYYFKLFLLKTSFLVKHELKLLIIFQLCAQQFRWERSATLPQKTLQRGAFVVTVRGRTVDDRRVAPKSLDRCWDAWPHSSTARARAFGVIFCNALWYGLFTYHCHFALILTKDWRHIWIDGHYRGIKQTGKDTLDAISLVPKTRRTMRLQVPSKAKECVRVTCQIIRRRAAAPADVSRSARTVRSIDTRRTGTRPSMCPTQTTRLATRCERALFTSVVFCPFDRL